MTAIKINWAECIQCQHRKCPECDCEILLPMIVDDDTDDCVDDDADADVDDADGLIEPMMHDDVVVVNDDDVSDVDDDVVLMMMLE